MLKGDGDQRTGFARRDRHDDRRGGANISNIAFEVHSPDFRDVLIDLEVNGPQALTGIIRSPKPVIEQGRTDQRMSMADDCVLASTSITSRPCATRRRAVRIPVRAALLAIDAG